MGSLAVRNGVSSGERVPQLGSSPTCHSWETELEERHELQTWIEVPPALLLLFSLHTPCPLHPHYSCRFALLSSSAVHTPTSEELLRCLASFRNASPRSYPRKRPAKEQLSFSTLTLASVAQSVWLSMLQWDFKTKAIKLSFSRTTAIPVIALMSVEMACFPSPITQIFFQSLPPSRNPQCPGPRKSNRTSKHTVTINDPLCHCSTSFAPPPNLLHG